MRKTIVTALGVLAFTALAGSAFAQMNVMAADANKDGKITKDESWAFRDANKDGFVSAEELGQAAQIYMAADTNKDGKLSKDEYFGPNAPFTKWDANKDGALTEAEITAGIQAAMAGR